MKILKPKIRVKQEQAPVEVPVKKDLHSFRQAIKNEDIDAALQIHQSGKEVIHSNDLSILVEKLIQNDRVQEAKDLSITMLNNNMSPLTRVFRFLLNRLANNGDVAALEEIGSKVKQS